MRNKSTLTTISVIVGVVIVVVVLVSLGGKVDQPVGSGHAAGNDSQLPVDFTERQ